MKNQPNSFEPHNEKLRRFDHNACAIIVLAITIALIMTSVPFWISESTIIRLMRFL